MMQLLQWATRWGISSAALADLQQIMGTAPSHAAHEDPRTSEAYVQSLVRGEAPRYGVHLWRNNVGAKALLDEKTGQTSFVRWGLANETAAQNKVFKSGDLIGWRSFVIGPQHVGARFAQFMSRECKHVGWTWKGDAHEEAQANWAQLVIAAGGDAKFVTGEGSFDV